MSRKKLLKKAAARWQMYLIVLVPMAFTFIFSYIPMGGVVIAFKDYNLRDGIWGSPWVGWEQFIRFFESVKFKELMVNTLMISLYSLAVSFPIPIIFALFLNALPFRKFKKLIQTVTYMPYFISTVVMVGIINMVLDYRIGLYGNLYSLLTNQTAPNLMTVGSNFRHLYVWSGVWQGTGYSAVIYLAALAGVDPSLHEAAILDGASRLQRIRYIDIPGILPTITILLIMKTGNIMSVGYEKVFLMQNDLNIRYSEVISTYVYKIGLAAGLPDYSYSTAIGLFNSVLGVMLLLLVNWIAKKLGSDGIF